MHGRLCPEPRRPRHRPRARRRPDSGARAPAPTAAPPGRQLPQRAGRAPSRLPTAGVTTEPPVRALRQALPARHTGPRSSCSARPRQRDVSAGQLRLPYTSPTTSTPGGADHRRAPAAASPRRRRLRAGDPRVHRVGDSTPTPRRRPSGTASSRRMTSPLPALGRALVAGPAAGGGGSASSRRRRRRARATAWFRSPRPCTRGSAGVSARYKNPRWSSSTVGLRPQFPAQFIQLIAGRRSGIAPHEGGRSACRLRRSTHHFAD